jgi:DNA-binding transcriptional MerR regulator
MPIISELKSINRLEAAGFTHDQAKAIVEVAEDGQQNGFNRFVEVLDQRLGDLENHMNLMEQRLRLEIQTTRSELLKEQRDQILRFAALVTLIVSLAGTLIGAALKWL